MLLSFLVNLKDTIGNCGLCDGKAVRVLANFFSDGAEEVCEAYTSNGMSTDGHIYFVPWPVTIKALIQRFLTKIVLQEEHDLVT